MLKTNTQNLNYVRIPVVVHYGFVIEMRRREFEVASLASTLDLQRLNSVPQTFIIAKATS